MTEKATRGEMLDALLCAWLLMIDEPRRALGAAWLFHAALDCGAPAHIASAAEAVHTRTWDPIDSLFVPGGWSVPAETRLLSAIASEEAADRLETATGAVILAADIMVSAADTGGPYLAEHRALFYAVREHREAQLQAYSPHEATGLVQVTDG